MTESEYVRRAKKGDDEAFSALYSQVYQDMYRYAYYALGNREDAEDVVSETVLDAYRGIAKLREDSLFRNWIFKILVIKCKNKRKSYMKKTLELDEAIPSEHIDQEERYDVQKAFADLSEEEKKVVSMAVFGGYRSGEIGKLLGLNANTVRSKLSRALGKMEKKLYA